jgi:hypothetical protein
MKARTRPSKSEVYSWRLTSELKTELETAAKDENLTVSSLLEGMAREWLDNRRSSDDEQRVERRRAAMLALAGTIPLGGGPYTNKRVRELITAKLKARHGRSRPA